MKSPQEPPQNPNENTEELNFEQELKLVEDSLQSIRERYVQVQRDQQIQARLQKRKDQLQQQLQHHSPTELKAELKQVQAKLDELEITLESRLFAWSSLKEPFCRIRNLRRSLT
jgi:ABC-type phosphate transport system auxiliary subunit